MKHSFEELFRKANETYATMPPEEQQDMWNAQKRSLAIAEAGFGSDAYEAEYRAALAKGDLDTLARLDVEAAKRIAEVERFYDRS